MEKNAKILEALYLNWHFNGKIIIFDIVIYKIKV